MILWLRYVTYGGRHPERERKGGFPLRGRLLAEDKGVVSLDETKKRSRSYGSVRYTHTINPY